LTRVAAPPESDLVFIFQKATSPVADRQLNTFFVRPKESIQRNAAPPHQPAASFGWMNPSGGCATRPDGAHTPHPVAELKQSSPKSPDEFIHPQWRRRGRKRKDQKLKIKPFANHSPLAPD